MYNQYISFGAFINGQWCRLFIDGKSLSMGSFVLNLEHNVHGIAMGKNKFFLVFADFSADGNISYRSQFSNNVSAYDYNGVFLYNIKEIIPVEENYQCAFIDDVKDGISYPYEVIKGHEYLTCNAGYRNYVIDITMDKLVAVLDAH